MANRLVGDGVDHDLVAGAQRALDSVRRPTPTDVDFLDSLLRLRGFRIDKGTAADVLRGHGSGLSSLSQEFRLLRGLQQCLVMIRERASNSLPPDGWFLLDLFSQ